MNKSFWKALEYARDGMFVPEELTREMVSSFEINTTVVVMFSFEMIPTLLDLGYQDITLVTEDTKKYVKNFCKRHNVSVRYLGEENMKFEGALIIGNPPYQNAGKKNKNAKLWYDFSVSAVDMNPAAIAFVTPEAAFKDIDSNGKKMRKIMSESGYGLKEFQRHKGKWFDVGVETSHWIVEKGNPTEIDSGVFTYTDQIAITICEKVVSYPNKLKMYQENNVSKEDTVEDGEYEFYRSGKNKARTNKELYNSGKKVLFPFSASYTSLFYTEDFVSGFNKIVNVKDEDEAKVIVDYCLSDLFIFVANTYKKTSGFCPFVKNELVPDLRGIDTKNLYKVFGLSQEEIEYVERSS